MRLIALVGMWLCAATSVSTALAAEPAPTVFEEKPRWEFGLGAASVSVPDYPSSPRSAERSLVLPYFIYRGERVRMQNGGVNAVAVENSRFTLDLSVGGSLNADSSANPLRVGMPDLDYLFEIGPRLEWRFFDRQGADGRRSRLNWSSAARAVLSTDFSSIEGQGFVVSSKLNYRLDGVFDPRLSVILSAGPVWASERLHDYFFEVDPQFATANRPAFDADGGYLGTDLRLGLMFKFRPNLRVVAGFASSVHDGSANTDSPLYERDSTSGFAVGLIWQIRRSEDTVLVIDN
jgi:outer membrane scaffolding protein for murein synthesis (MipA/OmpV family)